MRPRHRPALFLAAVCAVVLAALLMAPPAAAATPEGVTWAVTVDGRSTDAVTPSEPLRLAGGGSARVTLAVVNGSETDFAVRYVRLEGRMLRLSFYAYTTRVDLVVPPAREDRREFDVDLLDLGDQAVGLIPSRVVLLDAKGKEIGAEELTVDVDGSMRSVYGTFGLAVAATTALTLPRALWRLARGRLPANRWRRALALAAPGLGLGFTLTFTLSVLRWAAPQGGLWATFLVLGFAVGFVAGYLSPTPDDGSEEADDAEPGGGSAPEGGEPVTPVERSLSDR